MERAYDDAFWDDNDPCDHREDKARWVEFCENCECGNDTAEVFTDMPNGWFSEGDKARCEDCGRTGFVSVYDAESVAIHWDDEED